LTDTGEIKLLGDDIGIAVHIAARLLGLSGPGGVLISSTVEDLVVGSGITVVLCQCRSTP
jgi:class 3 adenylate cyclase